jgi:hypothetical protein
MLCARSTGGISARCSALAANSAERHLWWIQGFRWQCGELVEGFGRRGVGFCMDWDGRGESILQCGLYTLESAEVIVTVLHMPPGKPAADDSQTQARHD